jgi:hypothetical protein
MPVRCGRYTSPFQDPPDRGGTDLVSKLEQLALNPLVTPAVVLGGHPFDQLGDRLIDGRTPVRGEYRPVGPVQARFWVASAQHGDRACRRRWWADFWNPTGGQHIQPVIQHVSSQFLMISAVASRCSSNIVKWLPGASTFSVTCSRYVHQDVTPGSPAI